MPLAPFSTAKRRSVAGITAIGVAAGALIWTGNSTVASTQASGSVTDTETSTSWTGGPFLVANVTGRTTGLPDCSVPGSCDDFTLNVVTPAGYGLDHEMVVEVGWANASADFDVYLLDSTGNLVGSAESSADPERVVIPPTSGTYTVRVVPFAPLGESYTANATLTGSNATSTAAPAGFTNYPATPGHLPSANNAGEPSIGTNWKSGATLFQAALSTLKVTFDDTTNPATATWSHVSPNPDNGCAIGGLVSLDPVLFTDPTTGRTIASQLAGVNSLSCTTDDDGVTWAPSMGGGIPSGVDHQSVGGGPYAPSAVGALPTYPNIVYYCSQDIATAFCASSRDGGTTFGAGVPTFGLLECSGIHGHIKVGPDGTAYLPNKSCGTNQAVAISRDNGLTWNVKRVPGTTVGANDPAAAVGANNTVYFGYIGSDGQPGVAVSRDHGETWTDRQFVGGEFGIENAVFPTMVAGDDDRAAFSWIGTPTGGNYQDTANFKGEWHLYITTTYDGGVTWHTTDATPNDPVQRGSICTAGTVCGADRNLLDFIDSAIDKQGRIQVAYADGCIFACVTDPTHTSGNGPIDAQAKYATIARQSSGSRMFAAYDPVSPNVTLSSLGVVRNAAGQLVATIMVRNAGATTLSGVGLQLLDGRKQVHTTSLALAPGAVTTVTATWSASGASHTILAVVDPQNLVAESDETDNKALYTIGTAR